MDNAAGEPSRDEPARPDAGPDLARFEVRGPDADRALIRALARRLAEGGPEAATLRGTLVAAVAPRPPASTRKGGILAALRASPLVGSGIDLTRTRHPGRDIDL